MRNTKELKQRQYGITLIALVITIVVLLILVGVSIAMLTGNNGILTQAKNVKHATEEAEQKEKEDLIKLEMLANNSNVNIPNLKEGMIPVKWNAINKTWEVADKSNTGNDWYDYSADSKKWANVVTVKENCSNGKTRTDYLSAGVGTPIPEDDITTMFVWIPRYSYYVKSGYHENANGTGEFSIKFLIGISDKIIDAPEGQDTAIRTSNTNGKTNGGKYVVHPAFTSDTDLGGTGSELSGIWVGKFEASNYTSEYNNRNILASTTNEDIIYGRGDKKNVTIRPNVTSWRLIDVNDIFTVSRNMSKDEAKIYGFNNSEITTTMMQNSQWGAVAYLAQSEYGNMQRIADGESGIWNNSYNEGFIFASNNSYKIDNWSVTLTGMSGNSRDSYTNYYSKVVDGSKKDNGDSIEITYTNINENVTTGDNYTNTYYRYYTENGQKASTTRNIYGIYDMSGASWEYMANYLGSDTGNTYVYNFLKIEPKYQTPYAGTGNADDRIKNCKANNEKYGEAIWETSNSRIGKCSWNADYSYFPYVDSPFFLRGGNYHDESGAGLFYFSDNSGGGNYYDSFRVVLF